MSDVDPDPTNATLVVVKLVKTGKRKIETKYRLACKAGPLKSLYCRSSFTPVTGMTAEVLGLTTALESWQGMPVVGIRAAMKTISAVGGQGLPLALHLQRPMQLEQLQMLQEQPQMQLALPQLEQHELHEPRLPGTLPKCAVQDERRVPCCVIWELAFSALVYFE